MILTSCSLTLFLRYNQWLINWVTYWIIYLLICLFDGFCIWSILFCIAAALPTQSQLALHEVILHSICELWHCSFIAKLIKRVQILTRRNNLQPRFEHRAKHLTQRMHTQCSKSYSPSPFIGQYKYWWGRCLPCQTNDALRHGPVQWRAPLGWDQSEPGSRGESEPVIVLLETTFLRQRAKRRQLLVKRSNKTCDTKSWIHSHRMEAISESQWACVTYSQ